MSPKDDTGSLLSDLDWVFAVWFGLVVLWNFGYPEAMPLLDVLAAIGLFFISKFLRN